MKANWGDNEMTVASRADLDAVILSIRKSEQPTMVFLEADNGRTLVFGIGQEESVLTFAEPDGTSFHSLGDATRKGHLLFFCRDEVGQFMMEMAVPEQNALDAAEQFLTTQERPSRISWEPDW